MPLMPYQPISMTTRIGCDLLRPTGPDRVVLSTVPPDADPGAPALAGLRVEIASARLVVHSIGSTVADVPATDVPAADVPAGGPCRLSIVTDPAATTVDLAGRRIGRVRADVRPEVAGLFGGAGGLAGVTATVVTDTRDQTGPSPLKIGLAGLALAALLAALSTVAAADRRHGRALRRLPRRWWRPAPLDALVVACLAAWTVIGPLTSDDGYIAGIVRSRGSNGFIGDVFRWLNAPEAPFGYYYELLAGWSRVSASPLWMRVPSSLLGVLCWWLISRGLLPRLGRFAASRWVPWLAAAAFGTWWLPYELGVRPEPWVATGLLGVLLAVERAIATRRVLPLLVGLVIVAATVAVTPTGIIAGTPYLAAALPVLRLLRARRDLGVAVLLVLGVAAGASTLLLMYADQSWAAVSEANRVRLLIGGGEPWFEEFDRYARLLTPGNVEGPIGRRVPVLLTLLAVPGVWWAVRGRTRTGVAAGPARRLVGVLALSMVAMTATPTKWTYHFGALAGVGTGLLVLLVRCWSTGSVAASLDPGAPIGPDPLAGRDAPRVLRTLALGTAAVTAVAALSAAGLNQWPYLSDLGLPFNDAPPTLHGTSVASLLLAAGGLLVAGLVVAALRAQLRPDRPALARPVRRLLPSPGALGTALMVGLVAFMAGSFLVAAQVQRGSYSLAADELHSVTRPGCGLADRLTVETDPAAGLLPAAGGEPAALDGVTATGPLPAPDAPLQVAGATLPGWRVTGRAPSGAPAATARTGWYSLPTRRDLPLVITIAGTLGARTTLTAEYGHDGTPLAQAPVPDPVGSPGSRDARLPLPPAPGTDQVRLRVSDGDPGAGDPNAGDPGAGDPGAGDSVAFAVPRVPVTRPMTQVVPPGSSAVIDWPVAFVFPCLRFAALADGLADVPAWRVATPRSDERSAGITYAPSTGGPFAVPAMLVHQQRIPVYPSGAPLEDIAGLYRWVPLRPMAAPTLTRSRSTVPGTRGAGPMLVPAPGQ